MAAKRCPLNRGSVLGEFTDNFVNKIMEKDNNKPTQSSLFPHFSILCQTSADLIELCFILCALLLKPISITFR